MPEVVLDPEKEDVLDLAEGDVDEVLLLLNVKVEEALVVPVVE